MFGAVIFDWDGTLADTRIAIIKSFQKALGELNLEASDEFIGRRIGIGVRRNLQRNITSFKIGV